MEEKDELDSDFDAAEVVETSVVLQKPEDFVSLIDQPDWKSILISLVKSERMDPWNIDVKVLAQKYLEKIKSMQHSDLRLPANAILASAILLKFKARALRLSSIEEEVDLDFKSLLTEEQLLGGMMPELVNPRLVREGKVTLDQLVESIESILEKTKIKVQRELSGRNRPQFQIPFQGMNVNAIMEEVMHAVKKHADSTGLALFSHLAQGHKPGHVIELFLGLLFLVNNGRLAAWQDSLFGEIFVSTVVEKATHVPSIK
jgi:segregation and condensation protein A